MNRYLATAIAVVLVLIGIFVARNYHTATAPTDSHAQLDGTGATSSTASKQTQDPFLSLPLVVASTSQSSADPRKQLSSSYQILKNPQLYLSEYGGFSFDYDGDDLGIMEPFILPSDATINDDEYDGYQSYLTRKGGIKYVEGYVGKLLGFPPPAPQWSSSKWKTQVPENRLVTIHVSDPSSGDPYGSSCNPEHFRLYPDPSIRKANVSETGTNLVYKTSTDGGLYLERGEAGTGWYTSVCADHREFRFRFYVTRAQEEADPLLIKRLAYIPQTVRLINQ